MNSDFSTHKIALTGAPLPVDMEFKSERRVQRVFARHGLSPGRCFGSKSAYRAHNPGHKFLPNANVFCRTQGKLWWGDLDLARDKPDLESVARQLRVRLYVLSEHDGRFEKASLSFSEMVQKAVWHTGGPIWIQGLRSLMRKADIAASDLALLLSMPEKKLLGRHDPESAIAIRQKLNGFNEWIGGYLPESWAGRWGRWLTVPHPKLGGSTPLEQLRKDGELSMALVVDESRDFKDIRRGHLKRARSRRADSQSS